MQFHHLEELKKEFKKFSGFMTGEPLKTLTANAIVFLSNPELGLPIENANCPIIRAFKSILENKKTAKTATPLILALCNCISSEAITGPLLTSLTSILEQNMPNFDDESCMRLLQLVTQIAAAHFLDISVFNSFLFRSEERQRLVV